MTMLVLWVRNPDISEALLDKAKLFDILGKVVITE